MAQQATSWNWSVVGYGLHPLDRKACRPIRESDIFVEEKAMLFIDANIYLQFYRTVTTTNLVRSLCDFTDDIFVTQQIVNEVERNKLKVVYRLLTESLGALPSPAKIDLPATLLGDELTDYLASQIERLKEAADRLCQSTETAIVAVLTQVSHSTDAVSQMLKPVFEGAVAPSEEELERARLRRELGHPPGKGRDPLGDQVTWEQVLSRIESGSHAWVVSKDSDYLLSHNGHCVLDPRLHDDLVARGKSLAEVHPFDSLLLALTHYQQTTGRRSDAFPPEEESAAILEEERRIAEAWHNRRQGDPGQQG